MRFIFKAFPSGIFLGAIFAAALLLSLPALAVSGAKKCVVPGFENMHRTWSGKCVNGFAVGKGTLTTVISQDGEQRISTRTGYVTSSGFNGEVVETDSWLGLHFKGTYKDSGRDGFGVLTQNKPVLCNQMLAGKRGRDDCAIRSGVVCMSRFVGIFKGINILRGKAEYFDGDSYEGEFDTNAVLEVPVNVPDCRGRVRPVSSSRTGNFSNLYSKRRDNSTLWDAKCIEGGLGWVEVNSKYPDIYAWGGMGFPGSTGGSDTYIGVEAAMQKACGKN